MKYDVSWLKHQYDNGVRPSFLFFNVKSGEAASSKHAILSQWHPSPFVVAGDRYAHAAHWMMVQKARLFDDHQAVSDLLAGRDDSDIVKRGRNIEGFDQHRWDKVKYDIVLQGNLHKFSQHKTLQVYISSTHPMVLTEASPEDPVWGIGMHEKAPDASNPHRWNGLNLLGFALMEVRDILANVIGDMSSIL